MRTENMYDGEQDDKSRELDQELYDEIGAARYEIDFTTMPRKYRVAHDIQNKLVDLALRATNFKHTVIVDFGCGTANDALNILRIHPAARYVGIDRSEPMLKRARAKLQNHDARDRARFLARDFRTIKAEEILDEIEQFGKHAKLACVVSALALHHYDPIDKGHIYRLMHSILGENGLFIQTDLYSSSINHVADWLLDNEVQEILSGPCTPIKGTSISVAQTTTLSEQHYRIANTPLPFGVEFALLKSAGFHQIEMIYRNAQLGVILAKAL